MLIGLALTKNLGDSWWTITAIGFAILAIFGLHFHHYGMFVGNAIMFVSFCLANSKWYREHVIRNKFDI